MHDFRRAELEPRVRALCEYAAALTQRPSAAGLDQVEALRGHGWNDEAIHDAIQVIAYFNYINRIADGVGVENEPEW
ncbi:MAG: hypothetical protein ABR569_00720 [Gaiellaceae bacterium]